MKVSESWLREWVSPDITTEQLAAQLTMAGLEVDGVHPVSGIFTNVVVGDVLHTKPHPQADKLSICDVNVGQSTTYTIVCGAANVRAGLKVAVALPGAHLPHDVHIKETLLRGELSQGMLCSTSELGMEDASEGIMELAPDAPVGTDLRSYLSLNDHILDIDLTPNRADCFSVLGVAREISAINQLPLKPTPSIIIPPESDESISVTLSAPEVCSAYCARIIQGININATTPFWIKERLRRSGIRCVHPVVDVTNYVMLELGQPMHAFDLQRVTSGLLIRYANADETLTLLNGQDVQLNENVLVIADSNAPLAIAGIMGGEDSAVHTQTTDILLESAFFKPVTIANSARQFGLCSDSSQRFERGVDWRIQRLAMERATELLKTIVGGTVGPINEIISSEHHPAAIGVSFNPALVKRLSGLEIVHDDMVTMLSALGMDVKSSSSEWIVNVPSHRFDIQLDVDLVEEIIRLYGYERMTVQPLQGTLQAGKAHACESLAIQLSLFLSHRGYNETISYSFVDPQLQETIYPDYATLQLLNPISQELSQMRAGMWPGLIASMIYNVHRQQTAIKLFETGVVFEVNDNQLQERPCIAGLITGEQGQSNWCDATKQFDFFDMKGDLQALFATINVDNIQFESGIHPALHPGQTATLMIADKQVGWLGVLHPRLTDALDITCEVIVFELFMEHLSSSDAIRYQSISKYPKIKRDLSLLVDTDVPVSHIENAVREVVDASWLKSFDVFDVYMGESVPTGKKSLAVSITLQDEHRTLVDAEINTIIDAIIIKLDDRFDIKLRD